MKTAEQLRRELKETCERTDTRFTGIEYLVRYYTESLHWTEMDALQYVLDLFANGTIDQIKVLGKDGEQL